jgi:hypothetical protein
MVDVNGDTGLGIVHVKNCPPPSTTGLPLLMITTLLALTHDCTGKVPLLPEYGSPVTTRFLPGAEVGTFARPVTVTWFPLMAATCPAVPPKPGHQVVAWSGRMYVMPVKRLPSTTCTASATAWE